MTSYLLIKAICLTKGIGLAKTGKQKRPFRIFIAEMQQLYKKVCPHFWFNAVHIIFSPFKLFQTLFT
jgi:LytS/YehU family sensor histidine kinase